MAAPFSRCLRRAPGQTLVSAHRLRDLHQLPGDAEDGLLAGRLDVHQLLYLRVFGRNHIVHMRLDNAKAWGGCGIWWSSTLLPDAATAKATVERR